MHHNGVQVALPGAMRTPLGCGDTMARGGFVVSRPFMVPESWDQPQVGTLDTRSTTPSPLPEGPRSIESRPPCGATGRASMRQVAHMLPGAATQVVLHRARRCESSMRRRAAVSQEGSAQNRGVSGGCDSTPACNLTIGPPHQHDVHLRGRPATLRRPKYGPECPAVVHRAQLYTAALRRQYNTATNGIRLSNLHQRSGGASHASPEAV